MGPLGEAASVAAHHSPCARPLTGHTVHSRAHARSPRASPRHAALPLCRQSLAICTLRLPARRRLGWCNPRGLAGARDTCGQQPISRRVLRDGACGRGRSASVHVVHAVRRGGSSSLCADSYLWVLCCGPYGAPAGATSPGRRQHDTPPAWNARTSVGAVVLCVCGVLCWEERERAASLPVGRHCCRVVAASLPGHEALLPSGIAAEESVRATDWVCVRACVGTLVDADAEVALRVVAHRARRRRRPSALRAYARRAM